jgi:hypothetical protein
MDLKSFTARDQFDGDSVDSEERFDVSLERSHVRCAVNLFGFSPRQAHIELSGFLI